MTKKEAIKFKNRIDKKSKEINNLLANLGKKMKKEGYLKGVKIPKKIK